jgi:hypothetical protein
MAQNWLADRNFDFASFERRSKVVRSIQSSRPPVYRTMGHILEFHVLIYFKFCGSVHLQSLE